ncbi:gamma-type small acid-soluble spore protein [Thermoflavimicrobium daqui]|uniref:Small, acid-soluble spore protein gamma-type n=1 Tax=Thermoflavimicrobium daqui TaxID=2137476 RepID=A0A364K611_9BACL|nr:gamma-type small acid-soluble spore protein [Thermoflavimicrobium daqui]RAL25723.1 gamma-type small acid-soluble spore protein [Thermoflavimicrobium daqui]
MDIKNRAKQAAGTNAQQVRAKNQRSAQSVGGYQSYESEFAAGAGAQATSAAAGAQATAAATGAQAANQNLATEFASETNAQDVRAKNQQSMANKNKNQQ